MRRIDWCFKGNDSGSFEDALISINESRQGELYLHEEENCSTLCREKGKSVLHVIAD